MKAKKSKKTKADKINRAKIEIDAKEMSIIEPEKAVTDTASVKPASAGTEAAKPEKTEKKAEKKPAKTAKKPAGKPAKKPADKTAAKKGGRPAMTAEEKAAAAKARKAERELEAKMVPVLMLQFAGNEVDLAAVTEAVRADFKANNTRKALTALTLYIKPEDGAAYYVANGSISGKVML